MPKAFNEHVNTQALKLFKESHPDCIDLNIEDLEKNEIYCEEFQEILDAVKDLHAEYAGGQAYYAIDDIEYYSNGGMWESSNC